MAKNDPYLDETRRVTAEYNEARGLWLANRDNPLVKQRHDRAMAALAENRRFWREVGEATGKRKGWAATVDNEDAPASLIEGA